MNWPVLIAFAIGAIVLVVFMIIRNFKDEKEFEKTLDNDYHKPKHTDTDANNGDVSS